MRAAVKAGIVIALAVEIAVIGVALWVKLSETPEGRIPYENTYMWTEVFGYEAYLDRRISVSVVSGGSMEPTFGDGDVVLLVEIDNMTGLGVGDIIIFKHPTKEMDDIAHRILEVNGDLFKTNGDALLDSDSYWVPASNVHGLVVGIIYKDNPRSIEWNLIESI